MSAPYIIWAMQRTGGTTLAALLSKLSEYQGVQHEPFNSERLFGSVVQQWQASKDPEALRTNIGKALQDTPVLKHCYELLPPELNETLFEVSTSLGYRHIILDRQAEVKRILSLELAKQTGAWGGKEARTILNGIKRGEKPLGPFDKNRALMNLAHGQARRKSLATLFESANVHPFVVYFEDVYSDYDAGRELVIRLIDFLGIDTSNRPNFERMVQTALRWNGQNSMPVINSVPNIDEVRAALRGKIRSDPLFRFAPTKPQNVLA